MPNYREVQPHGDIKEIFNNIYMVTGTNKIHHDNIDIQVSRNMVIVREGNELTLINTVRLNDFGLTSLDKLGNVRNIVRIGAFHGYDDEFYLDHYHAKLWAIKNMVHQSGRITDHELAVGGRMPFSNCELFNFETTAFQEGILILNRKEGTVLITCDSIQNWTRPDEFFSEASAKMFQEQGMIKPANIPDTWIGACKPAISELKKLTTLRFNHLISAHGEPLKDTAYQKVCETLKQKFNI
jgi:hypothetical protein